MDKIYEKKRNRRSKNKSNTNKSNTNKVDNEKEKKILKLREESNKIDYTLDGSVKQLFLNLTKYQIPFDYEKSLESYFPEDIQKDEHGNYFKIIGNNDIMFCSHLDTYCYVYDKVYHLIDNDIIKTDGTSTLGADDKAGVVIMLKMMESNIPGLYYFFRGEEGVTSPTGTWGSKQALKTKESFFKKYKKCIAFDRKGYDSIITDQMYSKCCSDDFTNSLIKEFSNNGLKYKNDPTGMWCDSGVFMELIPECTNISVGYENEHTGNEIQNINHLEKLVNACINIKWDELPVKRDPDSYEYSIGNYKYGRYYGWDWDNNYTTKSKKTGPFTNKGEREYDSTEDLFYHVCDLLNKLNYDCLNHESFEEAEEMYFQNYLTNDFFAIRIIDYEIYMTEDEKLKKYVNLGNLDNFETYVMAGYDENDIQDNIIYKDQFSEYQIDAFVSLINVNPQLVVDCMEDMIKNNNKSSKNSVSIDIWTKIENELKNLGYIIDYEDSKNGVNPDDFTDWVSENWVDIENRLKKFIINKKENEFLKNIKKTQEYTQEQYDVFSEIIVKSKELVKLVLKDIDFNNKPEVRDRTINHINDELKILGHEKKIKNGLRQINSNEFVNWCFDYTDDIKDYYNI